MNSYHSEMKVPIRPAPPPPVNNLHHGHKASNWNTTTKDSRNKSTANIPKKKPPPRPPPPKFTKTDKKQTAPRPSELITCLFQRKNNTSSKIVKSQLSRSNMELSKSKPSNDQTLIDFSSPPSSPTFTTRSSSDALSVNSFGSDGITPCSTSSGNTSNVESGFEDDFDFFFSSSKRSENIPNRDPWSPPPQDQRSKNPSPLAFSQNQVVNNKGSTWVSFTSTNASKKMSSQSVISMPTIIRVKPDRPKPPAIQTVKPSAKSTNVDLLTDMFESVHLTNSGSGFRNTLFENGESDDDEWSPSESPPMPTCPPPAPPPEALSEMYTSSQNVNLPKPYGVALYDYQGSEPDDLSFNENDIINLVRRVDENWLIGEKDGREGNVPVNFISIKVAVPEDGYSLDRYVTALYAFRAEAWEDLDFQEGSVIKVISRIDQDWLYGECDGKTGQFPANFIDRVPHDLPVRRNSD